MGGLPTRRGNGRSRSRTGVSQSKSPDAPMPVPAKPVFDSDRGAGSGIRPGRNPRTFGGISKETASDYHSTLSTQPQSLPEFPLPPFTYRHSNVCEPEVLMV